MRALKWSRIRNGYYATRYDRITVVIEREYPGLWLLTLSRADGARIVRQRERLSECRDHAVVLLADESWLRYLLDQQLADMKETN